MAFIASRLRTVPTRTELRIAEASAASVAGGGTGAFSITRETGAEGGVAISPVVPIADEPAVETDTGTRRIIDIPPVTEPREPIGDETDTGRIVTLPPPAEPPPPPPDTIVPPVVPEPDLDLDITPPTDNGNVTATCPDCGTSVTEQPTILERIISVGGGGSGQPVVVTTPGGVAAPDGQQRNMLLALAVVGVVAVVVFVVLRKGGT